MGLAFSFVGELVYCMNKQILEHTQLYYGILLVIPSQLASYHFDSGKNSFTRVCVCVCVCMCV